MPALSISRSISAPIDEVWDVFTDIGAAAERLTAVERIELLTDGPFAEGTRWRETRRLYGKSATEEMWVSHLLPQRSYTVDAGSTSTRYESRYDFIPVDDSTTRVTFTFSGESTGLVRLIGVVMWPLLKGRMAKDLRRDLDDLAKVCER